MANSPIFEIVNPLKHNPNFDLPENNFIEEGIARGVERGIGAVGDKMIHAGELRLQSFAENMPELATLALICYIVYIGYKTFLTKNATQIELEKIYPVTMVYIIFRLFWKVVLHI